MRLGFRDLRPGRADVRRALPPILRGTVIGSLCSLIPGTGPTIASFIAYAAEKKLSRTPARFGHGAIEGVAAPEASTHSAVQGDFIPTMSLGIPGDAVMALLLGALMIHGIQPGPRLIIEQPDIFWGLIASFWIGNLILVVLNVPMIGVWVKLLSVPYRFLYPTALFFVCIGVFSARNEMFDVAATLAFGGFGYLLLQLGFEPAPILLGFVLGPRLEENFRRSVLLSRGSLATFVDRPISAVFVALCVILVGRAGLCGAEARQTPGHGTGSRLRLSGLINPGATLRWLNGPASGRGIALGWRALADAGWHVLPCLHDGIGCRRHRLCRHGCRRCLVRLEGGAHRAPGTGRVHGRVPRAGNAGCRAAGRGRRTDELVLGRANAHAFGTPGDRRGLRGGSRVLGGDACGAGAAVKGSLRPAT